MQLRGRHVTNTPAALPASHQGLCRITRAGKSCTAHKVWRSSGALTKAPCYAHRHLSWDVQCDGSAHDLHSTEGVHCGLELCLHKLS